MDNSAIFLYHSSATNSHDKDLSTRSTPRGMKNATGRDYEIIMRIMSL